MSSITGQTVQTTGVEGEGVCPPGPCSPNPCVNGGVCSVNNDNTFSCECVGGYTGRMCEEDIDECAGESKSCDITRTSCDITRTYVTSHDITHTSCDITRTSRDIIHTCYYRQCLF